MVKILSRLWKPPTSKKQEEVMWWSFLKVSRHSGWQAHITKPSLIKTESNRACGVHYNIWTPIYQGWDGTLILIANKCSNIIIKCVDTQKRNSHRKNSAVYLKCDTEHDWYSKGTQWWEDTQHYYRGAVRHDNDTAERCRDEAAVLKWCSNLPLSFVRGPDTRDSDSMPM